MTKSKVILCAAITLSVWSFSVEGHDQTASIQTSKPFSPSASVSPSKEEATSLPIKYIGNAESHKFHRPSCPFARIMALNKRVEFHYRTQAVGCGHVPCRYCLPPVWTVVRGRLLVPAKTPVPQSELPAGPLWQPHSEFRPDPAGEIVPSPP